MYYYYYVCPQWMHSDAANPAVEIQTEHYTFYYMYLTG